jgi:hypothetical protein
MPWVGTTLRERIPNMADSIFGYLLRLCLGTLVFLNPSVDALAALPPPPPPPGEVNQVNVAAWYYTVGGRSVGPLDDSALGKAYLAGEISIATPVWWEGAPAWTPLGRAPRFAELSSGWLAMRNAWYYSVGGGTVGPLDDVALGRAYLAGQINEGTLVWWEGATQDWTPLGAAPSFAELSAGWLASRDAGNAAPAGNASGPVTASPPEDKRDNSRSVLTVTPRMGVAFPGEATPKEIYPTKLGFGFAFHFDVVVAVAKHFELGTYVHYSLRPITERGGYEEYGLKTQLLSVGSVFKVRFNVSNYSRIRVGALLGYNRGWQGFESDTVGHVDILVFGLNFAPSIEWSVDLTRGVALNLQLAAITQIVGKSDIGPIAAEAAGGPLRPMIFPPLAFFSLGTDFCVGKRR